MKHIVQFSGGKDSTAMLLMMLERGMPVDDIVFCDVGMEFPEVYEHIKKVEVYIGRKITRLKAPYSFEYQMKIVCRESDKYGEGKALHYIVPEKVDGRLLCCLRLRNMFNPELRYYVTRLDEKHTDAEILAMFGNRRMRKEPFFVAI